MVEAGEPLTVLDLDGLGPVRRVLEVGDDRIEMTAPLHERERITRTEQGVIVRNHVGALAPEETGDIRPHERVCAGDEDPLARKSTCHGRHVVTGAWTQGSVPNGNSQKFTGKRTIS